MPAASKCVLFVRFCIEQTGQAAVGKICIHLICCGPADDATRRLSDLFRASSLSAANAPPAPKCSTSGRGACRRRREEQPTAGPGANCIFSRSKTFSTSDRKAIFCAGRLIVCRCARPVGRPARNYYANYEPDSGRGARAPSLPLVAALQQWRLGFEARTFRCVIAA